MPTVSTQLPQTDDLLSTQDDALPHISEHLRPRPVVAAFDFDGTLTNGGSVTKFLVAVGGAVRTYAAVVQHLPGIIRAALLSGDAADRVKESLFMKIRSGQSVEHVEEIATRFAHTHLQKHARPDALARLRHHLDAGHTVVIVSASPECYIKAAASELGVTGVVATRLASDGGLLTGRYEGMNCRGREKYTRVMTWIRTSNPGAADPFLYAYGNSRGDLRLLESADIGVNMGRLGRFGRLRRFARLGDLSALDASVPN